MTDKIDISPEAVEDIAEHFDRQCRPRSADTIRALADDPEAVARIIKAAEGRG